MSLVACLLTAAGVATCEPARALEVQQRELIASLANHDSVSVERLCGNRLTIKNANNDAITVKYVVRASRDSVTVTLPGRRPSEPFSETFVIITEQGGLKILHAGTRDRYTQWGGIDCPSSAAVPVPAPPVSD